MLLKCLSGDIERNLNGVNNILDKAVVGVIVELPAAGVIIELFCAAGVCLGADDSLRVLVLLPQLVRLHEGADVFLAKLIGLWLEL